MTQDERAELVLKLNAEDCNRGRYDRIAAAQLEADGKRIAALEAENAALARELLIAKATIEQVGRIGREALAERNAARAALARTTGAGHDPA